MTVLTSQHVGEIMGVVVCYIKEIEIKTEIKKKKSAKKNNLSSQLKIFK